MDQLDNSSGGHLPKGSPQLQPRNKRSSFVWNSDHEEHHQHGRPSVSGMAVNLARNLSHMSAQKSIEAMHKVGSFLGVTQEDNHMDQWKEKFLKRVESGDIGFNVENILPEGNDDGTVIKQIEETISQVSAARHEQDVALEDDHADEYVISSDIIYEEPSDTSIENEPHGRIKSQHSKVTPTSMYSGVDGLPIIVYKSSRCDYLQAAINNHRKQTISQSMRNRKHGSLRSDTFDNTGLEFETQSSIGYDSKAHKMQETYFRSATVPPETNEHTDESPVGPSTIKVPDEPFTKLSFTGVHKQSASQQSLGSPHSKATSKSHQLLQFTKNGAKPIVSTSSDQVKTVTSSDFSESTWEDTDIDISESSIHKTSMDGRSLTSSVHFSPMITSIPQKKSSSKDMVKSVLKRRINQQTEDTDTDLELQKISPSKSILKDHDFVFSDKHHSGSDFSGFVPEKQSLFSVSDKHKAALMASEPVFIYSAEALKHYQEFVVRERIEKLKELDKIKQKMEKRIRMEQDLLKETMELSKEQVSKEKSEIKEKTLRLKFNKLINNLKKLGLKRKLEKIPEGSRGRLIQRQIDQLPEYTAWFTYIMCLIQLLIFVVLLGIGGVTNIGLEPTFQLRPKTLTFKGLETAEHWRINNIWIGPSATFMIGAGALFAPCMRSDIGIRTLYAKQMALHNGSMELGCCEVVTRSTAGTTTEAECDTETVGVGNWSAGTVCSERGTFSFRIPHVIRPCCFGLKGQCKMTSHEHCIFLEGIYHGKDGDPEHCSQVNCLSGLCGAGGLDPDPIYPYIPNKPNQWWRILVPVIYNQGVIQLLITVAVELMIGRPIERTAGPVRVAILFLVSGIMGLMIGSTMSPYYPQLGAGGAIFGLIGVLVVELAQSWHFMHRPWLEALKLFILFMFFMISGTLPFVDNFTLVGGFIFGVLTSIAVLPYITFGKWHVMRKRILILTVSPILFIFVVLVFVLFYKVQTLAEVCGAFCEYFNCLPYTDLMCKIHELW